MIDDSYDSDFPFPHLDPPELNDLGGKPAHIKYIGEDKAVIEHHMTGYWWDHLSSRQAYALRWKLPPDLADQIDYDPYFDEEPKIYEED